MSISVQQSHIQAKWIQQKKCQIFQHLPDMMKLHYTFIEKLLNYLFTEKSLKIAQFRLSFVIFQPREGGGYFA